MRIEKLKYTYNLRTNVFLSPFLKKGYFCPLLKEQFLMQKQTKTINYYLALWLPRPLSIDY